MANAYFLMVCILQSIPAISITAGVPTSFLPLGIVLIFDGFATAREDYKRHVDDHRANNTKSAGAQALRGAGARGPLTPHAPLPQRWSCATASSRPRHGATSAWAT